MANTKIKTIYLIKNYAKDLNMSLNYSIMYMMNGTDTKKSISFLF